MTKTTLTKPKHRTIRSRAFASIALAVALGVAGPACAPAPTAVRSFEDTFPHQLDSFPVVGPVAYTDDYGAARSGGRSHDGNDLMADRAQKLLAVEAGTLVSVGYSSLSGNKIWLVAEDGAAYFYAHLDSFAPGISEGKTVWAGQVLGTVGNTGNASGGAPHLHFEIHPGGRAASSINPYDLLIEAQSRGPVVPVA